MKYGVSMWVCVLGVLALSAQAEETFFLKALSSQRMFGPYTYAHGGTVTVGKVQFEIVRKIEPPAASRHPSEERLAQAAAEQWLRLIDKGAFVEAWDDGATYLKRALTRQNFDESLRAVHDALGDTISRTLTSVQYTTTLPSAPDGEYVILQFNVVRERKEQAVETVIPMLERNGNWRVSGYYVR